MGRWTDLRVTFLVFCGGVGVPSSPKYRLRLGASLTMDTGSGPITSVMHDIWSTWRRGHRIYSDAAARDDGLVQAVGWLL